MIIDLPPKEWRRPAIPDRVKRAVLERQGGKSAITGVPLEKGDIHFDHRPQLRRRKFDTTAWDTVPPANDPAYIEAITVKEHDVRTNGRGGERRISTYGSDQHESAKDRALAKIVAAHEAKLLAKARGESHGLPRRKSAWPSRKIPSRPFKR